MRNKYMGRVAVVALFLTALVVKANAAEEEGPRKWRWMNVWGIPDCVYICNPGSAGCSTNPDCNCDCFR